MDSHSHRSNFPGAKKPFKGKSKGKLKRSNRGKVEAPTRMGIKAGSQDMNRDDRVNRNKMLLQIKRADVIASKRLGRHGQPPKTIALVALDPLCDIEAAMALIRGETKDASVDGSHPNILTRTSEVDKNKQKLLFFNTPRDPMAVVDIAAVADVILLFISPNQEGTDLCVDDAGYHFCRLLKAQGFSCVMGVHQAVSTRVAPKKQAPIKRLFGRFFDTYFDDKPKVLSLENPQQCREMLRWISNAKLKEPSIRADRTYMLAEAINFHPSPTDPSKGTLELAGFARGRAFDPNSLVHIAGHDDYQLLQVDSLQDPRDARKKGDKNNAAMGTDGEWARAVVARPDPTKQCSLDSLNELDTLNNEQSVITEEEMLAAEQESKDDRTKQEGVSDYQSVWNDIVSSEDEDEDEDEDDTLTDMQESGPTVTFSDSVSVQSAASTMTNADQKEQRKKLEHDETTHPDEVDTPREGRASDRFARYRGLKSFRHSQWDALENLPLEYGHLSEFQDFTLTKNSIVTASLEAAQPVTGTRSVVVLRDVPVATFNQMANSGRPVCVWGLFQYERKVSVLHFQIRRNPEYDEVVKGKEPMVFQVGFRRFRARPIFTQHSTNADKHMVERYFHQGRFTTASVYGRIQFPSAPVLMFLPQKSPEESSSSSSSSSSLSLSSLSSLSSPPPSYPTSETEGETMVASGSLLAVNPSRLLIKRVILTGYPAGINKRSAVVRKMFWNPDDIRWFKPVEIWTKFGHVGHIKEPRGTKGYMKCNFNGYVKSSDTICMSLYKRQFPPFDRSRFE